MLLFQRAMFDMAVKEDSLMVCAKGLGSMTVLTNLLQHYCGVVEKTPKVINKPSPIVFVINFTSEEAEMAANLETFKTPPTFITNKYPSSERKTMYQKGGAFIVTSRILAVDLLTNVVDPAGIMGVIADKAHRITENCNEAFILNILHHSSSFKGFIKAFSDSPEALAGKFGFLANVMTVLGVEKVNLWPRFHQTVRASLEVEPEVEELAQPLTEKMMSIQSDIVTVIEMCLKELKNVQNIDVSSLTVENGLFRSFEVTLRLQLDPVWHKLSRKTKQLVYDIGVVRKLLPDLLRHDSITFFRVLEGIYAEAKKQHASSSINASPSLWLLTDTADRIFQTAKDRVYTLKKKRLTAAMRKRDDFSSCPQTVVIDQKNNKLVRLVLRPEENPKLGLLRNTIGNEICSIIENQEKDEMAIGGAEIVIFCNDYTTQSAINAALYSNHEKLLRKRLDSYLRHKFEHYCTRHGLQELLEDQVDEGSLLQCLSNLYHGEMKLKDGSTTRMKTTVEQRLFLAEHVKRELNKRKRKRKETTEKNVVSEPTRLQRLAKILRKRFHRAFIVVYPSIDLPNGPLQVLRELRPRYVILFDPNVSTVRQVEVYQGELPDRKLQLYFMQYEESVEEQRYLSDLKREQETFRKLINEKAGLVLSGTRQGDSKSATVLMDENRIRQSKVIGYNLSTGEALLSSSSSSSFSTGGLPLIVVDMREFRSALPVMLHKHGVRIAPTTVEIGDYILSPEICVERKSIPDLHGSFNSGRLFTQAEQMCKHYQRPNLLIEFDANKPFSLQHASDMTLARLGTSKKTENLGIHQKLALLTLHFPKLKLLWSPGPLSTVDLFKLMKANYGPPDPQIAAKVGVPEEGQTVVDKVAGESTNPNPEAEELLKRLPGITSFNCYRVMQSVESLRELSKLSQEEMKAIIGAVNAKKLYDFFHEVPEKDEIVDQFTINQIDDEEEA